MDLLVLAGMTDRRRLPTATGAWRRNTRLVFGAGPELWDVQVAGVALCRLL